MSRRLHPASAGVAHHLPHRTRLKVPRWYRTAQKMSDVRAALLEVPGVHSVKVNHKTGSVLIHHEEQPQILETVGKTLGEVSGELLEALIEGEEPEIAAVSLIGHFVHDAFSGFDGRVAGATANWLDLKTLVPLIFLGAGIWRARTSERWLAEVSPLVLFYYAFDIYWKFHGAHARAERLPRDPGISVG